MKFRKLVLIGVIMLLSVMMMATVALAAGDDDDDRPHNRDGDTAHYDDDHGNMTYTVGTIVTYTAETITVADKEGIETTIPLSDTVRIKGELAAEAMAKVISTVAEDGSLTAVGIMVSADRGDKPERPGHGERPQRPGQGDRPDRPQRPDNSDKPGHTMRVRGIATVVALDETSITVTGTKRAGDVVTVTFAITDSTEMTGTIEVGTVVRVLGTVDAEGTLIAWRIRPVGERPTPAIEEVPVEDEAEVTPLGLVATAGLLDFEPIAATDAVDSDIVANAVPLAVTLGETATTQLPLSVWIVLLTGGLAAVGAVATRRS